MSEDLTLQRRSEILSAARRCFIRRGIHATGMADIAREFGMSAGHIYNYFPSKTAIIEAIVMQGVEEIHADVDQLRQCAGNEEEVLKHTKRLFAKLYTPERMTLAVEMLAASAHDPKLKKIVHDRDRQERERLYQYVKAVHPAGERENRAHVEMMIAILEGVGMRILRNPDLDMDAVCELLAQRLRRPRMLLESRLAQLEKQLKL